MTKSGSMKLVARTVAIAAIHFVTLVYPNSARVQYSLTRSVTAMTLLTLLILTSIGWSSSVPGQDPPPPIKLNTDLVTVSVSVTDRKDRPVPGLDLGVGDFVVTDDGKPVRLEFFDKRGPASMVFVIDISSSMGGKVQELRGALKTVS